MRIRGEWTAWDADLNFKEIPGAMGVFEIADEERETIYIGHAGGDSPFGLRGELFRLFGFPPGSEDWNWKHPHPEGIPTELRERARYYRYEVNHQYYSRWIETLTRYREDFGSVPPINDDPAVEQPPTLGRYHWKSEDAPNGS